MAGAGYKLFNTGDVLTAAQVNTYLQEQVVMVFASATARTTALSGVLAEGMVSYLKDTNATEVYDGSAWVAIGSSGDITGVTAGTGISGGGTSGTVTITNDMATTITAAGDIVVGTGSGTYDNLPIGTTGQVLTADTSVSPYKVKWAAAAGGGKVLQVVSATTTTSKLVASTTYTDTNLTASITPSSATSKVLVLVSQSVELARNAETMALKLRLLRDSTTVYDYGVYGQLIYTTGSGTTALIFGSPIPITYLDSPATTSSITYKTQGGAETTNNSGQATYQPASTVSSIVLLEIGA
jgi:hypothetical protein